MGDGKALQMGTSHELGQNFAKVFDITYLDANGDTAAVLDDVVGRVDPHGRRADHGPRRRRGPAWSRRRSRRSRSSCCSCATRTAPATPPQRSPPSCRPPACGSQLDAQVATSFGRRATDWELKGVPVRIEVGPRDLAEGEVTIVRRDTGEKRTVPVGEVEHRVTNLLAADPGRAAGRRHQAPRRAHRRGRRRRRGRRGRPRSASPGSPGTSSGRRRGPPRPGRHHRPLPPDRRRRPPRQRGRARPRRLRRQGY